MRNVLDEAARRAKQIDDGLVECISTEIVAIKARELLSDQSKYKQYVVNKIQRGLQRVETEGSVSHQEVEKRFEIWFNQDDA